MYEKNQEMVLPDYFTDTDSVDSAKSEQFLFRSLILLQYILH